jgi:hypothetical protein
MFDFVGKNEKKKVARGILKKLRYESVLLSSKIKKYRKKRKK